MKTLRRLWKREEGVETMEFALIGGLIAVAAVAGFTVLSPAIAAAFTNIVTALSGT